MNIKSWLVLVLFSSQISWAHTHLKPGGNIPPRVVDPGLKTGPCGGIARTATPKVFVAGSTVQVDWEETINHVGRYEIYFSEANDTNWQLLKTVVDTQDTTVGLPHQYSTMITLPNTPCAACTIQLIQVMLDNPMAPSLYYSCGDVQLTPASGPLPIPGPTPTPTCP